MRRSPAAALIVLGAASLWPHTAFAIPIFAERYHLDCKTCHVAIPVLNAFGEAFRNRGYRLPNAPQHSTVPIALRYQLEYDRDPSDGGRRFTPGGVLLSQADVGAVSAFIHYNLGAGGGPSAPFLGYLSEYDAHARALTRLGLFELPLPQSPGQRLDDLQAYGYYGTTVGLNSLNLSSPRLGIEQERVIGSTRVAATFAL